jgi:hypothetical protein
LRFVAVMALGTLPLGCSAGGTADGGATDGGTTDGGTTDGTCAVPLPTACSAGQIIAVDDCRAKPCASGTCFAVTAETSVCVAPPAPEEQTVCRDTSTGTPAADECGCPGRECPAGEECRKQQVDPVARGYYDRNVCGRDECQRNEDCPPGQACVPPAIGALPFAPFNHCAPSECRGDADCANACLRCRVSIQCLEQASRYFWAPRCL